MGGDGGAGRDRARARPARRGAAWAEGVAWWAALLAGYLAIVSSFLLSELIVGALSAAAAAAVACAARRALFRRDGAEPARRDVRGLARAAAELPAEIVWDARWLALPARGGGFGEVRPRRPRGRGGPSRLGLVTLLVSTSPGTYVAQVVPGRDLLVVHRLGDRPGRLERRLER